MLWGGYHEWLCLLDPQTLAVVVEVRLVARAWHDLSAAPLIWQLFQAGLVPAAVSVEPPLVVVGWVEVLVPKPETVPLWASASERPEVPAKLELAEVFFRPRLQLGQGEPFIPGP